MSAFAETTIASDVSSPRARWTAELIAAAWILIFGSYAVAAIFLPSGVKLTAIGDVGQCLAAAFAGAACLSNAFSGSRRSRTFWTLLALGCTLWLAGQMLWTYFEVVLRHSVPNPFLGDVLLFMRPVPMIGALAIQPHDPRRDMKVRLGYVDFSLLLLWWVALYLFIVIPWQYVSPNVALYGASYDHLEMAENVFLVAGLLAFGLRVKGPWRGIYRHLAVAAALIAGGAYVINLSIDRNAYHTGSLFDLPLVAGFVWFGTAGLLARRLPALPARSEHFPEERVRIWSARLAMGAFASLPLLGLWALGFSTAPDSVRTFRVGVIFSAVLGLGVLVWLRNWIVDRERARLVESLQLSLENLKHLQAQLIQQEKLASLGQLAAGAAHEINNPLTGIIGYTDLLRDLPSLDSRAQSLVEKTHALARRIKTLVSSLLSFSRQLPGEKVPLDLNAVLTAALRLNEIDLKGKNIIVEPDSDPQLPPVRGDSNQLFQVFFNLMKNAVDALEEVGGGRIHIRTFVENSHVVAEFADSGAGIRAPHLVFDPFYTTKPVGKGTGLGLSICYGILQEHGGRISCFNRSEGGATFRLELPIIPETLLPDSSVQPQAVQVN
ncbi:MAG: sensor histidine kinase [Candidatus Acidiferrales bacterium]